MTFERQRTGERTFDYAKEGVAHYGLYAEWFEDLRRLGGETIARTCGWRRGIPRDVGARRGVRRRAASRRGRFRRRGRGPLRLGDDWQALLRRAGQPQQRARAWSWCVGGKGNGRAADVAVLNDGGRVQLVGSTARGRAAGGVAVGSCRPAARRGALRAAGASGFAAREGDPGLRGRRRARARGRRGLPLAGPRPAALRSAVRRLRGAKATQAAPGYAPSEAETKAAGRLEGRTFAGSSNARG